MFSILKLVFGSVKALSGPLLEAYKARNNAKTDEARAIADKDLAWLEAQQSMIALEQGKWYTAWVRPALCIPAVAFWWKVIIWDTLLQYGVTQYPGDLINWYVVLVPTIYIALRPMEKRNRK
jgi:hypothetical protein